MLSLNGQIFSSPKELNFVKNVGDLTLLSGKRITIKKNGTVYWSFQNLKKVDMSALNKLSSVLDDDLPPLGQSAEKKIVDHLVRTYLASIIDTAWYLCACWKFQSHANPGLQSIYCLTVNFRLFRSLPKTLN